MERQVLRGTRVHGDGGERTEMAFPTLSLVVICGASASADSVRRALWLPRVSDARRRLRDVLSTAGRPGTVAITQHDGYVLVHGLSALSFHKDWLAYSADGCRVLAFLLLDGRAGNAWALYEEGVRTRVFDERAGRDEGERRPYEPPPDRDEHPGTRIRALYAAMTERQIGEDLDLDADVDVWFVGPKTPEPRAELPARKSTVG
jgi:hypothetical protein